MKLILSAFAVGLLLTACSKAPSDADLRQKLQGTWTRDANPDFSWRMEEKPGGSNFSIHGSGLSEGWSAEGGTWQVNKGFLVLTMTNAPWENGTLGVRRYKVVKTDGREMVLLFVGADKDEKLHKK